MYKGMDRYERMQIELDMSLVIATLSSLSVQVMISEPFMSYNVAYTTSGVYVGRAEV